MKVAEGKCDEMKGSFLTLIGAQEGFMKDIHKLLKNFPEYSKEDVISACQR